MKKLISITIALFIAFSVIPTMAFTASAEAVTVGDTSIWCFIGTKSGTALSADVIYTTADYATPNEALDAAFETYASTYATTSNNRLYLNQDITFKTPYLLAPTTTGKSLRMYMNGFKMTFAPDTNDYASSAAFKVKTANVKLFYIYTNAAEGDNKTFTPHLDNPFFDIEGTTSSSPFYLLETINGDIDVGGLGCWLGGATVNGNVVSNCSGTVGVSGSTTINGNFTSKGCIHLTASGALTINGNINSGGRLQALSKLKANGNVECQSTGSYAFQVQSGGSGSKISGNLICHGKSTTAAALQCNGSLIVEGKTTIDGTSANMTISNCTFERGIFVNTTNAVTTTLDSTDIVGTQFYSDNELYQNSLNAYGEIIDTPTAPIKDGFTFLGWTDKDGKIVDMSTQTQGFSNEYYAKWSDLAPETIVVPADKNDYVLPDKNLLTENGKKLVCYKNSSGEPVICGSVAQSGETYTAVTVDIDMVDGAQMRIENSVDRNGIRFLTTINQSDISALTAVGYSPIEYGTWIAPSDYFNNPDIAKSKYAVVVTDAFYKTEGDNNFLAGSIVKLRDFNLNRQFSGQGYVKLQNQSTGDIVTLSASSNDNARSLYYVASKAYADKASYNEATLEKIKKYVDAVVIVNDGLIEVPTGYENPYIFTGKKVIPNTDLISTVTDVRLVVLNGVNYYENSITSPIEAVLTDNPDEDDSTPLRVDSFKVACTNREGKRTQDNCAILLPKSYTDTGTPTRLVIDCHGFSGGSNKLVAHLYGKLELLAHQGYAVLECDGTSAYHMGGPAAIGAIVEGYKYVLKNYNVYEEVFVSGMSMGGITSINLVCSDEIPVIAQAVEAPATTTFRQTYCAPWDQYNIKRVHGFYNFDYTAYNEAHGTDYTYSTFPYEGLTVTDAAREVYYNNFHDKIAINRSVWKYCSSFYDYQNKAFKPGYEDFLTATASDAALNSEYSNRVDELYSTISIDYPVPFAVYHGTKDRMDCFYSKKFVDAVNKGNGAKAVGKWYNSSSHGNLGDSIDVPCKDGTIYTSKDSWYQTYLFFATYGKID